MRLAVKSQTPEHAAVRGGSHRRRILAACRAQEGGAPAALTELGDEGTECWSKFKDYVSS